MGSAALAGLEPVMGLEVHCQLRTASKAFCACPTRFGDPPNTNTCPTCLGLPGALPAFNARALELGIRLAVATGCAVRETSVFARKHYFYTDLPKGYQISQHDRPLAEGGALAIELADGRERVVRLARIHLEEDAGKSVHDASPTATLVDYNRSGSPLAEVVTEPDFRSSDEVHAFLVALRQLVRYLGVSDGNMEEGSLRCDVNVSLRPRGSDRLGTRVELKNLNSFRNVVRAVEHEIRRQAEILGSGGAVEQGTRLWDDAGGVTRPLRRKEESRDYRYVPDPDLLVLAAPRTLVDSMSSSLPELPAARRRRFVAELGLPAADAGVLTAARSVADYFEAVAQASGDPRAAGHWVCGEVLRDLKEREQDLADEPTFPVSPERLADLIAEVSSGRLSLQAAKRVFERAATDGQPIASLIEAMGLAQVSDETALRETVRRVLAANAKAALDFRSGHERSFGFLLGQVMKESQGRANPRIAGALLREELNGRG